MGTLVGGEFEPERRLAMDAGYGLGGGGSMLTPYFGMTLGEARSRTMRGGARWELRHDLAVGVEATRSESADTDAATVHHLRSALRFRKGRSLSETPVSVRRLGVQGPDSQRQRSTWTATETWNANSL